MKHIKILAGMRASRYCLILFIFSITSITGFSQKIIYKIEWKDDSIGYMIAEKKKVGSAVEYSLESRSQFRMLLKFDLYSLYRATYENDLMRHSYSKDLLNDKPRSLTSVRYEQGIYSVEKDEDITKISTPINESIAAIYFNEPRRHQIFSERYGEFCQVNKMPDNRYELIKPDRNTNEYYFKGGICEGVKVNLDLATIYIKRIN